MYTTTQFENLLLKMKVFIEEIKATNTGVREVIGYINGKRYTWNEKGQCFFHKVPMPVYDLKFEDLIPEGDEEHEG